MVLAIAACLVFGAIARAQVGDASGADVSHAWAAMPDKEGGGARLIHFPPRSGVDRVAEIGSLRSVREVQTTPEGVAAVGDAVYLLFSAEGARTVVSGRAVEAVGGLWSFDPVGRLRAHPALPGEGPVRGFVGTDAGPAALVTLEGDAWAIAVLRAGAWESATVPGAFAPGEKARAVAWRGGPGAIDQRGVLWVLSGEAGDEGSSWEQVFDAPPGWFGAQDLVFGIGDGVVAVRIAGSGDARVRVIDQAGARELATVEGVSRDAVVAPVLSGSGAIALIWRTGEAAGNAGFEFVELSAVSGRELYRGPPVQIVPVSAGEFRLLVTMLVLLMAAVVLIAIRPVGDTPVTLPTGTALAEPGRRFAATVIDLGLALWVVSIVFGVRVIEIMSLQVLFEPGGWMAVPAVLVVGGVVSGVLEGAFGWSFGKVLMGCRVVRVTGGGRRAGAARAMVRSLIKWLLPPVATLALIEPEARHRGDTMTGLAVVVPVGDGTETGAGGGSGPGSGSDADPGAGEGGG